MIQTFLPYTSQETLADCIGSGRVNRSFEQLDATGPRHPSKAGPKFADGITYQILWRLSIGCGFSELLCHPGIGRRSRDPDMDHPSRLQFYDEEREEWSKEEIGHLYEIAGPDSAGMRAQKGRPLLPLRLVDTNRPHVLLDGALAHLYAQLQEFTTDPFSTPESIVRRHLPDQGDGFSGDLGLA